MATYSRIQPKQLLQEVEGYLDLAMVLSDQYPLSDSSRERIVERALTTLERLEPRYRDGTEGLYLRGQAYRVLDRFADALIPLREAARKAPKDLRWHILLSLGWCYKRVDKIDCAIQALEDALAVRPEEAIVHYNLACYWSLAQNVPLALVYLAQAFELEPEFRNMVADESDFETLRNHPEFVALTSVIV